MHDQPKTSDDQHSDHGLDLCWSCHREPGGGHFCKCCVKIQSPSLDLDYFTCLGVPQRLCLSATELEEQYYALSRQLHPDHFQSQSGQEQEFSVERSALLNQAYQTLKDPIARVEYLVAQRGAHWAEDQRQVPPVLAMEVLELQEQVMAWQDASNDADRETAEVGLRSALESWRARAKDLERQIEALFSQWDTAVDAEDGTQQEALIQEYKERLRDLAYVRGTAKNLDAQLTGQRNSH